MKIKRGSIYLVDFGVKYQSELGKIRPAVVIQSDYVNNNLDVAPFKSVLVIPLSTDIKGGRFRLKIDARDELKKDSELLINWMCTIDLNRFKNDTPLTALTKDELSELKSKLDFFMGYMDYSL
jgi:mRNA interferase MazF